MKHLLLLTWMTILVPLAAQNTHAVQFSWGMEYLPDNFVAVQKQKLPVAREELVQGKYVRYLHFTQTLTATERRLAETMGLEILGYIYPATYLVMLPEQIDLQRLASLSPVSIVAPKPAWKMAQSLREPPYGAWAVHGAWIDINLQVYPHVSLAEAIKALQNTGAVLLKEGNQNGILQLRVLETSLLEIAAIPFVQYLELIQPPSQKDDTRSRAYNRSNTIDTEHPLGKKFNGTGVNTLVRDDGLVGPHIDFKGRLINVEATNTNFDLQHADYVSGCVGGAGNLDPSTRGTATGATIYNMSYTADFQDQTLALVQANDITIVNTSYSDGCNTGYTLASQTVDKQLRDNPTLTHVFSAGNANGTDCGYGAGGQWGNITGGHKMAKNALMAANINIEGIIHPASSRGPAHDGRLKPDISAFGTSVLMSQPNNTYTYNSGTSFSAPFIAGTLAQLTQAYKAIHNDQEPKATLLKAAVLNTANELGNIGPDFKFGWGNINAWRALSLLEENRYLSGTSEEGIETNHVVAIPANVREARFMIVWNDPQALPGSTRTLVNDLDLYVLAPDGTTRSLPWKLDPTPTIAALNTPAGKGRDSLNNVEQVSIIDPIPGDYTVFVKGTDVPIGPQEYQLVWDFATDDVKITYPSGGEGFVPGEMELIHWDAYGTGDNFSLAYSTDDGATFNPIIAVLGDKRSYSWTVPNTLSGKVRLSLTRGTKGDTMALPFNIAPVPQNLRIEKACLDSITIAWNDIQDSLSYDVYLLGAKYMEIAGSTPTNRFTFPIGYVGNTQWIAVRATDAHGTLGRRSLAINWPGGLKGCQQPLDLGVRTLLEPGGEAIILCSSVTQPVSVRVNNEGLNAVTGGQIYYQVNNDPVVAETLPDILPGDTVDYTFQTPINLSSNGIVHLKVWSALPGDEARFNDTLTLDLPVVTQAVSDGIVEDFESSPLPPLGWFVSNPDEDVTWALTNAYPDLVGADGNPTRAYFIDNFEYTVKGEEDNLYMIPVNLGAVPHPGLRFDLAHRQYSTSFSESLRVELFLNCDLSATPIVVYEKTDPALATIPPSSILYVPAAANEWKQQIIDLGDYAGQTAVIRFVGVNGYGNNTYIDNIGIINYQPPVAEILSVADSVCRKDTLYFAAQEFAQNTEYTWAFGTTAFPGSATGPGPHAVSYILPGNNNVRLITTNVQGADTTYHPLVVKPYPTANFTLSTDGQVVTFTNTSNNASAYLWHFGDGMVSTETNPVHTYATGGVYTVTLDAINDCQTISKSSTVTLTVKTNDLSERLGIDILPNPTAGDFVVKIKSQGAEKLQLNLLNAQGQLLKTLNSQLKTGVTNIPVEGLHLPKGLYQLQVVADSGVGVFSVVVQ